MKKFAWQFVALVVAVCMAAATAGIVPTLARAEGLTVGAVSANNGASVNGVQDEAGKTLVTWTGASADVRVTVTSYAKEAISLKVKLNDDTSIRLYLMTTEAIDGVAAWGVVKEETKSGSAGDTLEFSWSDVTKDVPFANLVIQLGATETELSAVIEEWTIGSIAYTAPAYVAPPEHVDPIAFEAHDQWKKSDNVTIADSAAPVVQDEKLHDGMGLVTFDDTDIGTFTPDGKDTPSANRTYVKIPLKTGDPSKSGEKNLYIKYKATSGISDMLLFVNGLDSTNPGDKEDPELNFPNGTFICAGVITNAWNVALTDATPSGYTLATIGTDSYLKTVDSVKSLLIVFTFDSAQKEGQSVDFAGITWADAKPEFATDTIEVPPAKVSANFADHSGKDPFRAYPSVENDVEADEETGAPAGILKLTYTKETVGYMVAADYANFTKERSRLVVSYWSKNPVSIQIYLGNTSVQGKKMFPAGHNDLEFDLSGKTYNADGLAASSGTNGFRLYIDAYHGTNGYFNPDLTDNIFVLESVSATEPTSIGDLYKDGGVTRFTIEKSDAGTAVSYPAKEGTDYNVVKVDLKHWIAVDRFVKIAFAAEKPVAMAFYEGNSNTIVGATNFPAGENVVYVDTTEASSALSEGNWTMNIFIDAWADSEANTVTFKSIEFAKTGVQSAPAASALTIDYAAETVTFDAAAIEVFSDEEGNTAVASGATVTPGATLYFRAKASDALEASAMATLTLPARPEAPSVTPTTVTDSVIAITGADYATLEFRMGAGEWGVGSFTDLDPETEYTIEYRVKATATSFASETKSLKVTTAAEGGAVTPGGDEKPADGDKSGCGKGCGSMVAGFGGLVALLAAGAFVALKRK